MRVSWITVITTDRAAKAEQNQRVLQVAEQQIHRTTAEQQCEHRLAQHLADDPQRRAP